MAPIAALVSYPPQVVPVAAVNWGTGTGKGILIEQSVRSSYAVSGIDNLRPVLIAMIIPIVIIFKNFIKIADISTRNTGNLLNLLWQTDTLSS